MTAKRATNVGLLLLLVLPARPPLSATAGAQVSPSCSREMNRQETASRQFEAGAKRESMNFVLDDARREALSGVKARLEGDPTADALADMHRKWEEWQEFIEQGKTIETIFAELARCTKTGTSGCLNELIERNRNNVRLAGRVADALNDWIKSLGNDTISKAAERVERARGVMQNLTTGAGNLAMDAASGALQNCFSDMERRVEARHDPVDPRSAQPQSPPKPAAPSPAPRNSGGNGGGGSAGGMSAGTVARLAAGGVAAGAGLYVLNEYVKTTQCNQYETEVNSKVNGLIDAVNGLIQCVNASCVSSRQNSVNSAASSLNSTIGSWCTCLGPNAATELSAADKSTIQDLFAQMRSLGVSPGTLPSCFR